MSSHNALVARCMCAAGDFERWHRYDAAPEGEVRFAFSATERYERTLFRCQRCGHFLSVHDMQDEALYAAEYVDATYREGLRRAFDRIIDLPPESSDNTARVRRVLRFAVEHMRPHQDGRPSVLDVGSGLCVFLHRMKEAGWKGVAIDQDERQIAHAREVVGVHAVRADLMDGPTLGQFDMITFNKVLEHVRDPIALLARAVDHLAPRGAVYVELPDGEVAALEGPGREEFFIDHHHIFSAASVALLARRAGFTVIELERLREPSGKYTLRAFLSASHRGR